jgi:hypothetical protein
MALSRSGSLQFEPDNARIGSSHTKAKLPITQPDETDPGTSSDEDSSVSPTAIDDPVQLSTAELVTSPVQTEESVPLIGAVQPPPLPPRSSGEGHPGADGALDSLTAAPSRQ